MERKLVLSIGQRALHAPFPRRQPGSQKRQQPEGHAHIMPNTSAYAVYCPLRFVSVHLHVLNVVRRYETRTPGCGELVLK
jgi:hypothetical protein